MKRKAAAPCEFSVRASIVTNTDAGRRIAFNPISVQSRH